MILKWHHGPGEAEATRRRRLLERGAKACRQGPARQECQTCWALPGEGCAFDAARRAIIAEASVPQTDGR